MFYQAGNTRLAFWEEWVEGQSLSGQRGACILPKVRQLCLWCILSFVISTTSLPQSGHTFLCFIREILNDDRCPGFLLDALRSAIKKQRTVIKSKMLGIPVSECRTWVQAANILVIQSMWIMLCLTVSLSYRDETDGPLFERSGNEDNDTDSTDNRPQESRIRKLWVHSHLNTTDL